MSAFPRSDGFWTAQSSYWTALTAQGRAKAQGYNPPLAKAERKAELWRTRGEKYLRAHKGMAARVGAEFSVEVDPKLSQDVADTVGRLAPGLAAVWDHRLSALIFAAWRAWPVSTGLSRAMLRLEYIADGDQFVGRVRSAAPYTYFIDGHPHRKLLAIPGKALTVTLGRDVLALGKLTAEAA